MRPHLCKGANDIVPASIPVVADGKVWDGRPQQGLPDGQGQVQNRLGQRIAPGRIELVLPLLVEHRQTKDRLWNLQLTSQHAML